MAKHIVICKYCNKQFDANKEPYVTIKNRYVHKECFEKSENSGKIVNDKEKLENYIKTLFKVDSLDQKTLRLIRSYIEEYKYSYSGILSSLIYFYEIKKEDPSKANGSIGIIPYIYEEARKYYHAEWLSQRVNSDKNIADYIPRIKKIQIVEPKPIIKKNKEFSFLDEEE